MKARRICRYWTSVGLALIVVGCLAQPASAGDRSLGIGSGPGSDAYNYPVRPGTDAWKALKTHDDMVRVTQLDEAVLATMSDGGLLRTVQDYPLLGDIMLYDNPQQGFDAVRSQFGGLQALLERDGVPELLLRRYQRMDATAVPAVLSLEEQGRRADRIGFVELLLAQPEVLARMSEEQREELLLETLHKREQKLDRFDVYGLYGLERTALTAGRALQWSAPDAVERESLDGFLDTGFAPSIEALDAVFAGTERLVLGETSQRLSERAGLAAKDYNSTVYTPHGTAVPVIVVTSELPSGTISNCNSYLDQTYPNATRLSNCSKKYNCHSWAWYSPSTSNNKWMNSPGDDAYWLDGSYFQVSAATPGCRVSYASDDHSAIVVSSSLFKSKWGSEALMQHAPSYAPYNSSVLHYYCPPSTVTVSGPSTRDPNQSGTWTCGATYGLPPYTYSWFKSWAGGGYQDLGGGNSKTTSHSTSFNIGCDVTDATGRYLGSDYQFVDVDGDPGPIFQ